jgi:flavin-binding protein dodecin
MFVLRIIEVEGNSSESSDAAVRQALRQASHTMGDIRGIDVLSTGLRGPRLEEWHARVRVALVVDSDSE